MPLGDVVRHGPAITDGYAPAVDHTRSREPSAFIFDMDGVLIDSERPALDLLRRLLSEAGVERDLTVLRALCGQPAGSLRSYLATCFGDDDDAVDGFIDVYSQGKLAQLANDAIGVFPRTHEVLAGLRSAGVKLALATSTVRDLALRRLAHLDLLRHFDHIVTGDEVANGKPAPDIFLRAAAALGDEPERCVVVEDSLVGVAAGRSAGMRVFAIASTFLPDELTGADRVFTDMAELEAYLTGPKTDR
jgi:HAD superfamily hydrolase (TIGR01509 family)